jgi:hypothetical protein
MSFVNWRGNIMKNLTGAPLALLSLALSLATPQILQAGEPGAAESASDNVCTVSSSEGGTMIDVSNRLKVWQLMQGQNSTSAMRVKFNPGDEGKSPTVSYHAINTQGTGAVKGRVRSGGAGDAPTADPLSAKKCAQGKHFKEATLRRTNQPIVTKDVADFTCDTSGDPSDPIVTVHLSLPSNSKATFQDLHFSSTDGVTMVTGGPGGGPRIQARCAAALLSSDGADLLLPAVQK